MSRSLMQAAIAAALLLAAPSLAAAAAHIPCSDLPKAEQYFSTHLKPGPNTDRANRHLAAAKAASSPGRCSAELSRADYYAKRSMAADRRAGRTTSQ